MADAPTKLRRAKIHADASRKAFEDSIREAHASGLSLRVIAAEAGLSFQRIHQIVHKR